jgi:hypothetical protein
MSGNLCGENTGESLSRWCAAFVSNNALADFATAPQWVADGMPDFVNNTDNTDQSADSTGCGMAFTSWMISQGHSLSQIAPAMVNLGDGGTFAELYGNLTSDDPANAWPNFQNAINSLPNGVTNDDPFNGLGQSTRKRLTNTPVRQSASVLKCPDDRKNRVVSTQATHPCGSSAVGGRVCEQRYAVERVLPESRFELQHTGSPSKETALEEKA